MAIRATLAWPDRATVFFQPTTAALPHHPNVSIQAAAVHPTTAVHPSLSDPARRRQAHTTPMVTELLQLVTELRDLNRQSISILKTLQQPPSPPHILVQVTRADVQTTCEPTNLAVEDLHLPQHKIEVSIHGLPVNAVVPTNTTAAPFVCGSFTNNYADAEDEVALRLPQEAACDQCSIDALNAPAPHPVERGQSESSSLNSKVPDYFVALDAFLERSHGTAATNNEFDTAETPHSDDDIPPPAPFEHVSTYAFPVGSPWPDLLPPYIGQPVYYYTRIVSARYDKALLDSVD
jgi:hypothetical protein